MSQSARLAIEREDAEVFASAVSAFEVSTKFGLGKLPEGEFLVSAFASTIAGQGFRELAISAADGIAAGQLPRIHRDPFDRLLIAQAVNQGLTLVSNESVFDSYGVDRLW
jgi:PIN domain nuclease of toxin-antitoxin system